MVVIGKSWRKKSCRRAIYSLLVVKDCEMGGCKQEENPWDISLRGIIDRKKISTRRVLGVLRMKIHSVNSVLNSARLTIDTRAGKTFSSQPFIFDASLCLCKRIYIYICKIICCVEQFEEGKLVDEVKQNLTRFTKKH